MEGEDGLPRSGMGDLQDVPPRTKSGCQRVDDLDFDSGVGGGIRQHRLNLEMAETVTRSKSGHEQRGWMVEYRGRLRNSHHV